MVLDKSDGSDYEDFEDVCKELGFESENIETDSESAEIEL